jgi:hypothetical protein
MVVFFEFCFLLEFNIFLLFYFTGEKVLREIISQICVTPLCVIASLPKKLSCVSVVLKNSCCFCIANTLPSLRACTQAMKKKTQKKHRCFAGGAMTMGGSS